MCIMEVNEHSHPTTMLQACGHNTETTARDLAMMWRLFSERGRADLADSVHAAQTALQSVADDLLTQWAREAALVTVHAPGTHAHGSERQASQADVMTASVRDAKRFETRRESNHADSVADVLAASTEPHSHRSAQAGGEYIV